MISKKVSIIVCCYNEEYNLPMCLQSLKNQTYSNFEIIVVDDGSTDKTFQTAQKYGVKVIRIEHAGLPTARNVGIRSARGDIIAFTDADCAVGSRWLEKLVNRTEKEKCEGVVGGTVKPLNFQNPFVKCLCGGKRSSVIKCNTGGYNMAYKRETIIRLGGFNPHFVRGGDYEFYLRALENRCKIGWVRNAVVFFTYPNTLRKLIKQQLSDGFYYRKIMKQHPQFLRANIFKVISSTFFAFFHPFRILSMFSTYNRTRNLKLALCHFMYTQIAYLMFQIGFRTPYEWWI